MLEKRTKYILLIIAILVIGLIVIFIIVFSNKKVKNIGKVNDQNSITSTTEAQEPMVFIKILETATDTDHDGLSDEVEKKTGLNQSEFDTDHDGLSDATEIKLGTDPKNWDTDGDGFGDGEEVMNGYNPKGTGKL